MTHAPPARALAFVKAWRPLVDEIILAVDERADPDTARVCAPLVDRLSVIPAADYHMERYLGWLHEQCGGDWIIRADDDELPSAALATALPALIGERHLTHFWLPRRWAYPTSATYLAEGSWLTDIQIRLVRNIPGLWRFPGLLHTNIQVTGASRIASEPLLHLANIVVSPATRARKIARYDELLPDARLESGAPTTSLYSPDTLAAARLAPLAAADGRIIDIYLREASEVVAPPRERPNLERPDRAELERFSDAREVSPGAYAAKLRLIDPVVPMRPGALQHVTVEVINRGDEWWPQGPDPQPPFVLGHRWHRADGTEIEMATPRTPFTERVAPRGTTRLTVALLAPDEAGEHTLALDVVHEFVRWFGCAVTAQVGVETPAARSIGQTA